MNLHDFLQKKQYHSISLKKTITNHFELKAKINNVKGRFILDTGASNTCVGLHLATHFGLTPTESDTKASGAGAVEIETQVAKDVPIKIGKWKLENLHLVLIDLSHVNAALEQHNVKSVEGIIGADILEKGKAIIDYKNKRLYLHKKRFSK